MGQCRCRPSMNDPPPALVGLFAEVFERFQHRLALMSGITSIRIRLFQTGKFHLYVFHRTVKEDQVTPFARLQPLSFQSFALQQKPFLAPSTLDFRR